MKEKECISLFLRPFFDIEESGVDLQNVCPYGKKKNGLCGDQSPKSESAAVTPVLGGD